MASVVSVTNYHLRCTTTRCRAERVRSSTVLVVLTELSRKPRWSYISSINTRISVWRNLIRDRFYNNLRICWELWLATLCAKLLAQLSIGFKTLVTKKKGKGVNVTVVHHLVNVNSYFLKKIVFQLLFSDGDVLGPFL